MKQVNLLDIPVALSVCLTVIRIAQLCADCHGIVDIPGCLAYQSPVVVTAHDNRSLVDFLTTHQLDGSISTIYKEMNGIRREGGMEGWMGR